MAIIGFFQCVCVCVPYTLSSLWNNLKLIFSQGLIAPPFDKGSVKTGLKSSFNFIAI